MIIHDDPDAVGCAKAIEDMRRELRVNGTARGLHSAGGRHTRRFEVGAGWLGRAVLQRIRQAGHLARITRGFCWGNVLPPGSMYLAHDHKGQTDVAVWCLTGSGALHIEPDVVIPDRAGQLVIFSGSCKHWVPKVESERITIAANLNY